MLKTIQTLRMLLKYSGLIAAFITAIGVLADELEKIEKTSKK